MNIKQVATLTPEQAEVLKQKIINKARLSSALDYGFKGFAGGALLGGAGVLAKGIGSMLSPAESSFTRPVKSVVYRPDRPQKGRKRAGVQDLSTTLPEIDPAVVSESDPADWAVKGVAAAAGVPLGLVAGNLISRFFRSRARQSELSTAQREFEAALQQYAEVGDQERKLQKSASLDERSLKLRRLAENCDRIAKEAGILDKLGKGLTAYTVLSALGAGAYGFQQQWDKRDFKDLQTAEKILNSRREKSNPTFPVARLKSPPDLDEPTKTSEDELAKQEEVRRALDEAVEAYDTGYL